MRKLRIFTALSCAFLMFVLSGCQSSEAFRPSADDTWGDLCRKFEPEWFDALPMIPGATCAGSLSRSGLTRCRKKYRQSMTALF